MTFDFTRPRAEQGRIDPELEDRESEVEGDERSWADIFTYLIVIAAGFVIGAWLLRNATPPLPNPGEPARPPNLPPGGVLG